MDAILLEKISKRISEDQELRWLLEKYHGLSETQESLLGYYLDGKLAMSVVMKLMPSVFDIKTLDRVIDLVQKGEELEEAEAITWLESHGFNKLIRPEELENENKEDRFVCCKTKDRLTQLIKANDELGFDSNKLSEFLEITKDCYHFKLWRTYYHWCHAEGFNDESTRIIVVGYRLFCKHGVEYLKAIIDLPELASKMRIDINFGSHLDDVVELAESKVLPQTILDLFATVRGLPMPNKDSLSYNQAFGARSNEVIQYWINHPYEVVNRFGHPRSLERDDFCRFLSCANSSTEAACYVLEAISISKKDEKKSEIVWTRLMKSFNLLYRQTKDNKILVKLLFSWLSTTEPRTRVENISSLITKIMSQGWSFMAAFVMEANLIQKKELVFKLRRKSIREALKSIYIKELGENLFATIYNTKRDHVLAGMDNYHVTLAARDILKSSNDIEGIQGLLAKELDKLTCSQYTFMNRLAKAGCTLTATTLEILTKMNSDTIERIEYDLDRIDSSYWPELIRLEAEGCRINKILLMPQELKFLLNLRINEAPLSTDVIIFAKDFLLNGRHIINGIYGSQVIAGWGNIPCRESNDVDPYFARLVYMGLKNEKLVRLCMNEKYINEEMIKILVNPNAEKIPLQKLIAETYWTCLDTTNRLAYTKENCEMLMKICNNHKQDVPVALKALYLGFDFIQVMELVLANKLNDKKITEMLLERSGITTKKL